MDFNQSAAMYQYYSYPQYPYWISEESYSQGFPPLNGFAMARQGVVSLEEIIKSKVATFRRWKQTKLFKRHPRWDFQFSIMTYNILSQRALECHRYLYRNCSDNFLQEEYRMSKILPEIFRSRSDIVCLQEVEQHLFDNLIKHQFNNQGFESIFKRRTGGKSDGCAILWNKKKFNLLTHSEVEFKARGNKYLNRDNVGLIAVLSPKVPNAGNTQLHVATTHLIFNPKRGEVKLCQLRLLLAELERMALKEVKNEERLYNPTILCGDFNIEPRSPLYQFIESGSVDVTDCLSGDLSGQSEGKNRGKRVNRQQLSLHKLGINEYSRFEKIPNVQSDEQSDPGSNTSLMDTSKTNSSAFSDLNDPCIVAAIGSSKDPRWLETLRAIGQQQLASEIESRMDSKVLNKSIGSKSSTFDPTGNPANHNNPLTIDLTDDEIHPTDTPANQNNPMQIDLTVNEIQFTHDFKFEPVYNFNRYTYKDMPITSMAGNQLNRVDHIFYSVKNKSDTNVRSDGQVRLLSSYSLMRCEEVTELGGLPNAHLGSDHLSLIAQFGMCFKR